MLLPATMFLAMVAYLPTVVSATVAGRWVVLSLGAAALLWTTRRTLLGSSHVWGAGLLLWAGLSTAWSVSPLDSAGEMIHWITLGALFLAASQSRDHERVLTAMVVGLCVSVPLAMLQMQGATPVEATDIPAGLFLSRNAMGEVAACLLVWSLARRAWPLIPAPLLLVVISGSRGALLACLVGGSVLLWRAGERLAVAAVALLVVVAAVMITVARDPTMASVMLRLEIWQLALSNISLIGHGLETFGTLAPRIVYVHSDPIQVLFELGVVGAVLAGAWILGSARSRTPEAAALCAILAASLVSFPLHHPMGAALVAVLAGLAHGDRCRCQRAERLLRDCGATRTAYESEPGADLRRTGGGVVVVAARQKHSLDAGDLARHVQRDREETRA